ncbi:hypothetical protein [Streptomyces sp. NPDC051636]|uniref:hypothetical protein n=1 Tax=Streptomyces sp. NPDC051636 TaxID=3365663 RepID=UPI0037915910
MFGTHRAHVTSTGKGNGRYSYSYTCSCGHQGGNYSSDSAARTAARKHEGKK